MIRAMDAMDFMDASIASMKSTSSIGSTKKPVAITARAELELSHAITANVECLCWSA